MALLLYFFVKWRELIVGNNPKGNKAEEDHWSNQIVDPLLVLVATLLL
jgi:hypothetical protein